MLSKENHSSGRIFIKSVMMMLNLQILEALKESILAMKEVARVMISQHACSEHSNRASNNRGSSPTPYPTVLDKLTSPCGETR